MQDSGNIISTWYRGEGCDQYYLGKTPLYVQLKTGQYWVSFVHPAIQDYHYVETSKFPEIRPKPEYPFTFLYGLRTSLFSFPEGEPSSSVQGKRAILFWVDERHFETKPGLSSMITLFQKKDQPMSELMAELPHDAHFSFDEISFRKTIRSYLPGSDLTDKDITAASQTLTRTGVWLKQFDELTLIVEVQPQKRLSFLFKAKQQAQIPEQSQLLPPEAVA